MAYTKAKTLCSEAELVRFACCFLNSPNALASVDWDAAAADFDSSVKPASFKTVTMKAANKVKKAVAEDGGAPASAGAAGDGAAGGGKGKGRKRKAEGEDGEKVVKKGMGAGRGGKKGKKAAAEEGEVVVAEEADGEDDGDAKAVKGVEEENFAA